MPTFEFTSPAYLVLLAVYFVTSSIKMFDVRMTQAKMGRMGHEMADVASTEPPLPSWTAGIYWLDWLLAAGLFVLNWKITIGVWIVRFILKVLPVLETFGNLFMAPFRPKRPAGVRDEHFDIANAIIALNNTSTEDKNAWDTSYARMKSSATKIQGTHADEKAILDAMSFLGGQMEDANQDVSELCEQRRRDLEWEAEKRRWDEERNLEEERDERERLEMDAYLRSLDDDI